MLDLTLFTIWEPRSLDITAFKQISMRVTIFSESSIRGGYRGVALAIDRIELPREWTG